MTHTYDSSKQQVREKATMEKPDENDFYEYDPEGNKPVFGFNLQSFKQYCQDYEQHLASLKSYPAIGFDSSFENRELELGKDFELQKQIWSGAGDFSFGGWEMAHISRYNSFDTQFRRIVAVPLAEPKPDEGGKDELEMVNNIDKLCIESLPPDLLDKWDCIKKELFRNRKNLNISPFIYTNGSILNTITNKKLKLDTPHYFKEGQMAVEGIDWESGIKPYTTITVAYAAKIPPNNICPNCKNNQTSPDYNCELCHGVGYIESSAASHPTKQGMKWVDVKERLPEVKQGEDNSENVFAILDGRVRIMAYCYIDEGYDDMAEKSLGGWAWCDCGMQIDGDPEFDDNYKPTHWMPLPTPPSEVK